MGLGASLLTRTIMMHRVTPAFAVGKSLQLIWYVVASMFKKIVYDVEFVLRLVVIVCQFVFYTMLIASTCFEDQYISIPPEQFLWLSWLIVTFFVIISFACLFCTLSSFGDLTVNKNGSIKDVMLFFYLFCCSSTAVFEMAFIILYLSAHNFDFSHLFSNLIYLIMGTIFTLIILVWSFFLHPIFTYVDSFFLPQEIPTADKKEDSWSSGS